MRAGAPPSRMCRVERLRSLARRLVTWSDWPVAAAIVLSLAAVAEVEYVWTGPGDSDTGVVLSLLATAPLVLSRRRHWLAVVLIVAGVCGLLFHYGSPTIAALVGQLTILYVVGSRYPRRRSALALLPLAGNVVFPYTGDSVTRVAGVCSSWPGSLPCGWVTPPANVGRCSPSTTPPASRWRRPATTRRCSPNAPASPANSTTSSPIMCP